MNGSPLSDLHRNPDPVSEMGSELEGNHQYVVVGRWCQADKWILIVTGAVTWPLSTLCRVVFAWPQCLGDGFGPLGGGNHFGPLGGACLCWYHILIKFCHIGGMLCSWL